MESVADFFISFIDWNESIDFGFIMSLVLIYILVFWIAVSVWVYKDATNRFGNKVIGILLGIGNFFLFFPFLMLYFLIRPEIMDDFDDWHEGGVNIPIVNFVGEEGIEMSFEMRINPKRLSKQDNGEMKIDINFESDDEHKQLRERKPKMSEKKATVLMDNGENHIHQSVSKPGFMSKISGMFSAGKQKVADLAEKSRSIEDLPSDFNQSEDIEIEVKLNDDKDDSQKPNKQKKNKHKHKKNKKKKNK